MKISKKLLDKVNQRIKNESRRNPIRLPDNGAQPVPGQLWSIAGGIGAGRLAEGSPSPAWLLILIEALDEKLLNAVPVFRWSELAGPDDVYLPRELFGADLIAALALETTVDRSVLGQCHGRLPKQAVQYLLEARAVADDPVKRNVFTWGADWLSAGDHRMAYAAAIHARLEELQSGVRSNILSDDARAIPVAAHKFQVDIQSLFDVYPARAAADTGEQITPCVVTGDAYEQYAGKPVVRETTPQYFPAQSIAFDPLIPGDKSPICCEWRVVTSLRPKPDAEALIYDSRTSRLVGRAAINSRQDELLLIMNDTCLDADAPRIDHPSLLRIVINMDVA